MSKYCCSTKLNFFRSTKANKNTQHSKLNGETKDTMSDAEQSDIIHKNGDTHSDSDSDTPPKKSETKKKKKTKSNQKEKQLLKKKARMLREQAMSDGFEVFNFSSFAFDEQNETKPLQNGDVKNEQTSPNSPQKRTLKHASDGNKPKRRKSIQTA